MYGRVLRRCDWLLFPTAIPSGRSCMPARNDNKYAGIVHRQWAMYHDDFCLMTHLSMTYPSLNQIKGLVQNLHPFLHPKC